MAQFPAVVVLPVPGAGGIDDCRFAVYAQTERPHKRFRLSPKAIARPESTKNRFGWRGWELQS